MAEEGVDSLGYSRVTYAVGDEADVATAHVAHNISPESMEAVKRVSEAAWQLLRDTEDDRAMDEFEDTMLGE